MGEICITHQDIEITKMGTLKVFATQNNSNNFNTRLWWIKLAIRGKMLAIKILYLII